MKLNGTPRHYMPLSQSQSDDEENMPKPPKFENGCNNLDIHKSFEPQLHFAKHSCEDPKCLPMSPLRTFAFVLSLFMCVFFIVIFLWLLPCESISQDSLLEKWSVTLDNISTTTGIALAKTSAFSSPLLVFGYSRWETESKKHYGVMALRKTDGEKRWQIDLHFQANAVMCDAIDVNNDGSADCLVIGLQGLITAIDAKTGNSLWYLHSHSSIRVADMVSMPTMLPDCDGDLIPELAVSYTFSLETNSAYIGLISGGTGEVIGSPVSVRNCVSPVLAHSFISWKNRTAFVFYCTDEKAGNLFYSYNQDICAASLNRTEPMKMTTLYRAIPLYSDVQFHRVSDRELVVVLNGTKILLLAAATEKSPKISWLKHLKKNSPWRTEAHGHFLDSASSQLVMTSNDGSGSKVIGLNLGNGRQAWSAPFENSTVTSAFSLPGFFRDVDGIVLKMLATDSTNFSETNTSSYNVTNGERKEKPVSVAENTLQLTEESYVLLRSGKLPQFTKISVQDIWFTCKDAFCQPDIFTRQDTAVAAWQNNEEVDMSVISTSLVPSNSSESLHYQTTVKLLKLEKFSQFSKCMYKLGS